MRLGLGLHITGFRAGGAFSPADLFASGEQGAWYEPSTTTAFASTTDLTPCAAGDTCGFLLDKSQGAGYSGGSFTGLGPEEVTNGTFDTDTSGWTSSGDISWDAGKLSIDVENATAFSPDFSISAGKTVLVTFDRTVLPGDSLYVHFRNASNAKVDLDFNATGNGSFSIIVSTTQVIENISFQKTGASGSATIDNVSVREIPGNHATQATLASLPILRQTGGGLYYLEFDGTDDFLDIGSRMGIAADPDLEVIAGINPITTNGRILQLGIAAAGNMSVSADSVAWSWRHDGGGFVEFNSVTTGQNYVARWQRSTGDLGSSSEDFSLNGVDQTITNTGSVALVANDSGYIGARTPSLSFAEVNLYSLIVVNRRLTASEASSVESYVADKTGVTL